MRSVLFISMAILLALGTAAPAQTTGHGRAAPAAEGQPGSLRVGSDLIVEPREEKVVISHGMAVGGYWGGGWAGGPVISETRSINSREATLQIDLIDAASDELVWRGSDRMLLPERSPSPQERERMLRSLVQRILSGYPPQ